MTLEYLKHAQTISKRKGIKKINNSDFLEVIINPFSIGEGFFNEVYN